MVGQNGGCLNLSECFNKAVQVICICVLVCTLICSLVSAEKEPDVRLVVYSTQNESGIYDPVPPDMPLPEHITYSLRSPELGFVVIDTDPNETEYITNELLNLPWVEEIEIDAQRISGKTIPNEYITNSSPDQWAFSRIGIVSARESASNLSGCRVAVIDTGVDRNHPDIVNISRGYDWVEQDSIPEDLDGHGTALSGIISLIAGNFTNPESNTSLIIIPERIGITNNSMSAALSALAIVHASDSGADIILMGYGGSEPSLAEERALDYAMKKGALLIAPAGNEDSNTMHYPSDNFQVISVGSIAKTDGLSYFSNYGIYNELVAPGEEIITPCHKGYCLGSGTSFAAAEVAGVAARIKTIYPGLNSEEIRSILQSTASDLGRTGRDIYYGYGLVNSLEAMKAAAEMSLQKTLKEFSTGNNTWEIRRNLKQGNFSTHSLSLVPGWNYVSFPAPLRSQKTCRDLFSKVNTDSHTIWTYRGGDIGWTAPDPDISPVPLEGLLVYSDARVSVPLILNNDSSVTRKGTKGWNLVGSSSRSEKPASELFSASNLSWVSILPFNTSIQQYDTAIIQGAEGKFADSRVIPPFTSFWIYLETNGTFMS